MLLIQIFLDFFVLSSTIRTPLLFYLKKNKFCCYGKCFVLKNPGFRLGGSGGSLSLHGNKTKIQKYTVEFHKDIPQICNMRKQGLSEQKM